MTIRCSILTWYETNFRTWPSVPRWFFFKLNLVLRDGFELATYLTTYSNHFWNTYAGFTYPMKHKNLWFEIDRTLQLGMCQKIIPISLLTNQNLSLLLTDTHYCVALALVAPVATHQLWLYTHRLSCHSWKKTYLDTHTQKDRVILYTLSECM